MLKNLDPLLTPDLLATLARMGHGDVVAVVDRNFPAHSHGSRVVDLPGVDVIAAGRAVLSVLPVDTFADPAVWHMRPDDAATGPAFGDFRAVISEVEGRAVEVTGIARFEFYQRAREAYCVVATGEPRPYANFLITKGVVAQENI